MIVVQYLLDRNVLCITGVMMPFPAGSLEARRQGDMLAVAAPHEDYLLTQWTPFDGWMRPDGSRFATLDEAFAYLDATCRQKRPVGWSRTPAREPRLARGSSPSRPKPVPPSTAGQPLQSSGF